MVFTPYVKFAIRRFVSSRLSVNVSPSTRTPKTKGASLHFIVYTIWFKCKVNKSNAYKQTCLKQSCLKFYREPFAFME